MKHLVIFVLLLIVLIVAALCTGCAGPGYCYQRETVTYYGSPTPDGVWVQPYYYPTTYTQTWVVDGRTYYGGERRHEQPRVVYVQPSPARQHPVAVVEQRPRPPVRYSSH